MRARFLLALLASSAAGMVRADPVASGFGFVSFPTSCVSDVQGAFDLEVARLHSFDGPEDAFRAIGARDPACAMAWWGAAMSVRGNPLAGAPDEATLKSGRALIAKAVATKPKSVREQGFVDAMVVYYGAYRAGGHPARTAAYEAAMERLSARFPEDPEVQTFYGLAILEAVDLTDTTYARQRKAAAILERVWAAHPDHPGAPHYLIHADDYPPLARGALDAARRYPTLAPASEHAQHMPAHIYSMLGLWDESIKANERAATLMGHGAPMGPAALDAVDPHGMDFVAYARLQRAQDGAVADILSRAPPSEERTLVEARYLLERGDWAAAAAMPLRAHASALDAVTIRFTRAIGAARTGRPVPLARGEALALRALRPAVLQAEGPYWAGLVDVYAEVADAWIARRDGRTDEALALMRKAADLDDARAKHILLENKLLPMREVYGDLLLESGQPEAALDAYAASAVNAPNRFRGALGMARANVALARREEARSWYAKVAALGAEADTARPDLEEARANLKAQGAASP